MWTWSDGSSYEGEFVDWFKEGYGVFRWSNGSIYKGNWKSDKRHGKGV